MVNLQSFEWHKNMGLKCNTLPLVNRSPRLPFAFSFPSQRLCLILLSLQFPHLLSHILSWSFCPQFLSFIFHLQTNCLDSYTPNPSFFLFSFFYPPTSAFTRPLDLSFCHVLTLNRDSKESLGMRHSSQSG